MTMEKNNSLEFLTRICFLGNKFKKSLAKQFLSNFKKVENKVNIRLKNFYLEQCGFSFIIRKEQLQQNCRVNYNKFSKLPSMVKMQAVSLTAFDNLLIDV